MLQQLAFETGAQAWAVGSMIFFIMVFAVVVYRVERTPRRAHEAHARLPLDDGTSVDGFAADPTVASAPTERAPQAQR